MSACARSSQEVSPIGCGSEQCRLLGLSISSSYLKNDAFQNETEGGREKEREREGRDIPSLDVIPLRFFDYLLNIHGEEDEVVVGAGT